MALVNLARMTTTTAGTGTVTLGSAADGHLTFADAGCISGQIYSYGIVEGNNQEVGRGTVTNTGGTWTLSRDTVLKSTAGGTTKITLTGTAEVYITILAEDIPQDDDYGLITGAADLTNDYGSIV